MKYLENDYSLYSPDMLKESLYHHLLYICCFCYWTDRHVTKTIKGMMIHLSIRILTIGVQLLFLIFLYSVQLRKTFQCISLTINMSHPNNPAYVSRMLCLQKTVPPCNLCVWWGHKVLVNHLSQSGTILLYKEASLGTTRKKLSGQHSTWWFHLQLNPSLSSQCMWHHRGGKNTPWVKVSVKDWDIENARGLLEICITWLVYWLLGKLEW
jgi:hypothetical protein